MRTVEVFAAALIERYSGDVEPSAAADIAEDFAAGEFDVAAISVVEVAPVAVAEVDELERLAASFDAAGQRAARDVIAKRRSQFATR